MVVSFFVDAAAAISGAQNCGGPTTSMNDGGEKMVVQCRCCNGGAPVCFAEVCGAAQVHAGGVRRCCGGCRGCCRDGETAMEMHWWPAVAAAARNVAECVTELRRRWRKNA